MIINGIDIATKDLVLTKLPPVSTPQRRVRRISIPGRSGYLTEWSGDYESYVKTPEFVYTGTDLNTVLVFLQSASLVVFPNDPDHAYKVRADEQIESVLQPSGIYKIIVPYFTDPFRYDVSPEVLTLGSGTTKVYNPGEKAFPLATWAGTLTINGSPFVASSEITYDADAMVAYDGDGAAWDALTGTLSAFYLAPGWNTIATTAGATITPNWRYL